MQYEYIGVNAARLSFSFAQLRTSERFVQLENALAAKYDTVVIVMGAEVVPFKTVLGDRQSEVNIANGRTAYIFLETTTTTVKQVGGEWVSLSAEQLLVHGLAHLGSSLPPNDSPLPTPQSPSELEAISVTNLVTTQASLAGPSDTSNVTFKANGAPGFPPYKFSDGNDIIRVPETLAPHPSAAELVTRAPVARIEQQFDPDGQASEIDFFLSDGSKQGTMHSGIARYRSFNLNLAFLRARRLEFRSARRLAILIFAFFVSAGDARSVERCEYPSVFGNMLVRPDNHVGEFRIVLDPPDYQSGTLLQRHLAFSQIWGRMIGSKLTAQTAGLCSSVVRPYLFPDLRVFLSRNRSRGELAEDASTCVRALVEILRSARPERQQFIEAVSTEAARRLQSRLNPAGAGVMTNAANILDLALAHIYVPATPMHALMSAGPELFQSLSPDDFFEWLEGQRSISRFELRPLTMCGAGTDPKSVAPARLPHSSVTAAGVLDLSVGTESPPAPYSLRHLIIIGHGNAIQNSRFSTPALEKYCNKKIPIGIGEPDSDLQSTVQIRCLRTVIHDDGWTVLFCDSSDCRSERVAEAAMMAIARDSDIVAHAKTDKEVASRGPYRVKVRYLHK